MSNANMKESVEALKKTTHDLAEAMKRDSEDKGKVSAILADLQKKQEEFETKSQERKGFSLVTGVIQKPNM